MLENTGNTPEETTTTEDQTTNDQTTEDQTGAAEETGGEETKTEETVVGSEKTPKEPSLKEKAEATESFKGGIIAVGAKGVTNKQMIEAMIAHQESVENLQLLFKDFLEVFLASAHYTPDMTKARMEEFIRTQAGHETFKVEPMGKKIRTLLDAGTAASAIPQMLQDLKDAEAKAAEDRKTAKAVKKAEAEAAAAKKAEAAAAKLEETKVEETLVIAETFESEHNKTLANLVTGNPNWKSVLNEEQIQMVVLAVQDMSASKIAEVLGCSADKVRGQLYKNATSITHLLTA